VPTSSPSALSLRTETLIVLASVYWVLAFNRTFLGAALGAKPHVAAGVGLLAAMALLLGALHVLVLSLLSTRRTVKPLIVLLTLVGAAVAHYELSYGVVMDPAMVRNVLRTETAEAGELLTWRLALDLALYAALPIVLLLSVRIAVPPWRQRWRLRLWLVIAAIAAIGIALAWQFQPLASLMRNHKELRYRMTPLNAVWSTASVVAADARGAAQPRQAIGLDAAAGAGWARRDKPRLVVLVVGETARAANWGLSGYARQTTPRLAATPGVVNFADATACGTSTEVSLPCMFAPVGRRDYDEARILGSESLLHVAARAGVQVRWVDNNTGCKGVCDGLPNERLSAATAPGLCAERCLDEGLVRALDARLDALRAGDRSTQLLVLHMLGNHGPSYFRRYPPAFERFTPACRNDDLGRCTREEIVNAYDNALLYTDYVLASLITRLQDREDRVDSALLFMSDHGESLGEKGLFLHGVPWLVAPKEQTAVPAVTWHSAGFARSAGLDAACLRERAKAPVQHDHLFHSLLALLDVHTSLYDPAWDVTRTCRAQP
jgi:lipid A ethanolaminephosphotransferase